MIHEMETAMKRLNVSLDEIQSWLNGKTKPLDSERIALYECIKYYTQMQTKNKMNAINKQQPIDLTQEEPTRKLRNLQFSAFSNNSNLSLNSPKKKGSKSNDRNIRNDKRKLFKSIKQKQRKTKIKIKASKLEKLRPIKCKKQVKDMELQQNEHIRWLCPYGCDKLFCQFSSVVNHVVHNRECYARTCHFNQAQIKKLKNEWNNEKMIQMLRIIVNTMRSSGVSPKIQTKIRNSVKMMLK